MERKGREGKGRFIERVGGGEGGRNGRLQRRGEIIEGF